MFYTANAALAKAGLKVGDKIPHKVTRDALIMTFLKDGRLARTLLEAYQATQSEVLGIMNLNEEDLLKDFQVKAAELIATFDCQRRKRGEFQYQIGPEACGVIESGPGQDVYGGDAASHR